jgi:uncharacterized membrane protein YozB (DUF420 family)
MPGIFGTSALLQIDVNLILQIAMLLIIFTSWLYKKRLRFKIHGTLMGIAVSLHVVSFFAVMEPLFSAGFSYFTTATSELVVQIVWFHVVPGAIAMVLAIFVVSTWALKPSNLAACRRKKRLMDVTVLLWLVALMFGIATYIVFYT